jgi:hypothetical protein
VRAFKRLLSGGDRRSIAQSKRVLALVRATPQRVTELASLAENPDWLVSMRAIDLLEKIAHEHADWVPPHKKLFIGRLADSDKWEIQLQIVRALPRRSRRPCRAQLSRELERGDAVQRGRSAGEHAFLCLLKLRRLRGVRFKRRGALDHFSGPKAEHHTPHAPED